MRRSRTAAKRAIDVVAAAVVIVITAPVLAAAAIAVRLTMGRPVLFRQERAGLHGRPFQFVKLRTMHAVDPSRGRVTDAERLSSLGRFLRASSIDELPSMWSVLRGHMSLVGPRPLPTAYLARYSAEQARRHAVRPGVTGLAQVSGRNALSWDERLRLDVVYVDSWSLLGDLAIVVRTLRSVVLRDGISAPGAATMPEFTGSDTVAGES